MSISRFYTTTFTVKRQEYSNESSAQVSKTSFSGHIQQGASDIFTEHLGLRFTKAYTIWCPSDTDIQEGDRVTEGSNVYNVRFVENRNVGNQGHLHVLVEKVEA